jgi:hypothetical protein
MTIKGETIMAKNKYAMTLETLKKMDKKQLIELFHDIEDIQVVQRIADCAYHFTENYDYAKQDDYDRVTSKSEKQEWVDMDNAERYRDIKSTQD